MSLMVEEVYRALVSAGASDEESAAAARAIPNVENLATRQDIAAVKQDIAAVKQDLAEFQAATRQDIAELRAEFKQEIVELRAEFKQEIAALKSDSKVIKFVYGPAVVIMLAKLVFFP